MLEFIIHIMFFLLADNYWSWIHTLILNAFSLYFFHYFLFLYLIKICIIAQCTPLQMLYVKKLTKLYLITKGHDGSFISNRILNKTDFMFVTLCAEYLEFETCRDGRWKEQKVHLRSTPLPTSVLRFPQRRNTQRLDKDSLICYPK